MMVSDILRAIELFAGLSNTELDEIISILTEKQLQRGDVIATQGSPGEELFIITDGFVEVSLDLPKRVLAQLGPGQIIGEMSLVDRGPRSATVRAITSPTIIHALRKEAFESVCARNLHIGYIVCRNIAADLSFKIRHSNFMER